MKKIPRQAYTTELKELAVKRVKNGESNAVMAKELGLGRQHSTLGNQSPMQSRDHWAREQNQEKLAA